LQVATITGSCFVVLLISKLNYLKLIIMLERWVTM